MIKFFRFRVKKQLKLIIQSTVYSFIVLLIIVFSFHQIKKNIFFSDVEIKQFVTEFFNERGIDIQLGDEVNKSLLFRPKLTLNNVVIKDGSGFKKFFLSAQKIDIYFNYSSMFGKIALNRIRLVNAEIQFTEYNKELMTSEQTLLLKNQPDDLLLDLAIITDNLYKNLKLFPEKIELVNTNLLLENQNVDYQLKFKNINGFIQVLATQQLYLALMGETIGKFLDLPIKFNIKGKTRFNNNFIIVDNIDLILVTKAKWRIFNTQMVLNFSWDFKEGKIIFKPLFFSGKEQISGLAYQGQINQIVLYDQGHLNVTKFLINTFNQDERLNLDAYIELINLSCIKKTCEIENLNFGANYKLADGNFVFKGSSIVDLDLNEKSVVLNRLLFNSHKTGYQGAIPLWVFNLKGHIFFKNNDFSRSYLDGFLDNQAIAITMEYNFKENKKKWKIDTQLSSFDAKPYFNESQNSRISKYNQLIKQYSDLVKLLKNYHIELIFKINRISFPTFFLSNLSGNLVFNNQLLLLNNLTGQFFDGDFLINMEVKQDEKLIVKFNEKLNKVNLGIMLFYFINYSFLSGVGDVVLKLATEGNTVEEFIANLSGFSSFEIRNGLINGFDLNKIIYQQQKLPIINREFIEERIKNSKQDKTLFDLFEMVTYWENGKGETELFKIENEQIQVNGQGIIDLINKKLDYSLLMSGFVYKNYKRVDVNFPIRLIGDIFNPKYYLDYKQLIQLIEESDDKEGTLEQFIIQQWKLIN